MTKEERLKAAEVAYPIRYSGFSNEQKWMDEARRHMIQGFIKGAEAEAESNRIVKLPFYITSIRNNSTNEIGAISGLPSENPVFPEVPDGWRDINHTIISV